jgi:hypothetical protein
MPRVFDFMTRRLGSHSPRLGDLRTLVPFDRDFGFRRGQPVDRYYIARFIAVNCSDVRGRVLEVGDASYTRRFGGDAVSRSDVLYPEAGHDGATIVGDLATGAGLEGASFDCALITQTLLLIYDVHAAVRTLHRMLAPGGVLLVTLPGICQIAREDDQRWGDYWRFTPRGAARLFGDLFGPSHTQVTTYGNVLAATAFLYGLASQELDTRELDHHDPDYPVTIGVRAVKVL